MQGRIQLNDSRLTVKRTINISGEIDLILLSCNHLDVSKTFLEYYVKNTDQKKCSIIWIDNGSKDDTPNFLHDFFNKKITNGVLVLSEENLGVIDGRNLGFDFSEVVSDSPKPYVMYLDNDQFVCQGWLEDHLNFLKEGSYDLVGVEAWQLNTSFMPIKQISDFREHFSYVGCGGSLVKRSVIHEVGMFDVIFNPSYFEDPDFNFKVIDAGYSVGWNKDAKIIHMPHQTLGKIPPQEKQKRLLDSLNKFRNKWNGHKVPRIIQK